MRVRDIEIAQLPEPIREAFRERPFLTSPELAKLLHVHVKSLHAYIADGLLPARNKGRGKFKPRWCYSIDDVAVLWRHMAEGGTNRAATPPRGPNVHILRRAGSRK